MNSLNVHYFGGRRTGRRAARDKLIELLKKDKRIVFFYSKDYLLATRLPVPPTKKQRRLEVKRLREHIQGVSGRRYDTVIVDEYY